ncbi:hypothetical protein UB45_10945 [Terrabacter sp. 28]|nr:hypothetical protein UB45_10945 [Terrabacter sp. 28]
MSTSASDLLNRARHTLAQLEESTSSISRTQWESFDQTVYRLLYNLGGPGALTCFTEHGAAALHRAVRDYPQPLQPADGRPDFSTREAAHLTGRSDAAIRERILSGQLLAAPTSNGYRIPRSELGPSPDVRPATSDDQHAIARLAGTLGALNDLLTINRLDPSRPALDVQAAVSLAAQVLAVTDRAARRSLALCDPESADRPLAIARYAAKALTTLPEPAPLLGMQNPAVPPAIDTPAVGPAGLERAIHEWARAARNELRDAVPSVEVLKDVNRQSIHMVAALDSVLAASGTTDDMQDVRDEIRASAMKLQAAVDVWSHTSTGMHPSRTYVEAARSLYTSLSRLTATRQPDKAAEAFTYQVLLRGVNDAAWITALAAPWAPRLLDSGVLFIHSRHAKGTPDRLTQALGGRMIEANRHDLPDLPATGWAAERSMRHTARRLPLSIEGHHPRSVVPTLTT